MLKRCSVLILIIFITIFSFQKDIVYAAQPDVSSESSIVIEQKTGRVLYAKNIDKERAMASTTKIMTALVALEYGDLKDIVTISDKAAGTEGSSIWLEAKEQLTLEELLYGLMLNSGNDAAFAIGEHIGGGELENFIELMNKKAREIGALHTKFANPHGLDHKDHYTTAHELAKIASYAMENTTFRKIVATKKKAIPWSNHEWNRSLNNKNKMLWNYEGGNGIKTGYTGNAGKCLVSSAVQDDMQLISVVLKSNDIWKDSSTILDYSFDIYQPYLIVKENEYMRSIPVTEGDKERILAYTKDEVIIPVTEEEREKVEIQVTLPNIMEAPIISEQIIGKVEVFIDNEKIDATDIFVKESIGKKVPKTIFKKLMKYWIE